MGTIALCLHLVRYSHQANVSALSRWYSNLALAEHDMDSNVTVGESTNVNPSPSNVEDEVDETERTMETESTDITLESDDSEPELPSVDSKKYLYI